MRSHNRIAHHSDAIPHPRMAISGGCDSGEEGAAEEAMKAEGKKLKGGSFIPKL